MKNILVLALLVCSLFASELPVEHNFTQALQKAKVEHKQVMMMYSAVWCPECNYMKDVVFHKKEVVAYMQKHYVLLTLDIQKDTLPDGFEYPGIPTFFILGADEKAVHTLVGGGRADKFLAKLKRLK